MQVHLKSIWYQYKLTSLLGIIYLNKDFYQVWEFVCVRQSNIYMVLATFERAICFVQSL